MRTRSSMNPRRAALEKRRCGTWSARAKERRCAWGCNPDVTRESFQRAIVDGTAENCLASVAVRPGDAVFVPAGTAHTICPGVVLCEIQQHSDITYRVFDYNRVGPDGKPRALHIRQALDVMQFGEQRRRRLCDPVRITHGAVTETFYAACRHFAAERWEFRERIAAVTSPEHFDLLIFLEGKGPHRICRRR